MSAVPSYCCLSLCTALPGWALVSVSGARAARSLSWGWAAGAPSGTAERWAAAAAAARASGPFLRSGRIKTGFPVLGCAPAACLGGFSLSHESHLSTHSDDRARTVQDANDPSKSAMQSMPGPSMHLLPVV